MRHEAPIMPEEILIRPAAAADAPGLLAIYAPYVRKTAITFEYEVPSEEEFRGRIKRTLERFPYLAAYRQTVPACGGNAPAAADDRCAAKADGQQTAGEEELLGYAYAGYFKGRAAYDWSCETTVYVAREARGRGLGRALYGALEAGLKARVILNLYACIGVPAENAGADEYLDHNSEQFHAHMGYTTVGTFHLCGYKFGRWYNMIWMEKMIGEHC